MKTNQTIYNFDIITENERLNDLIKDYDFYTLQHDNLDDNRIFIDQMKYYDCKNKTQYNKIEKLISRINKKYDSEKLKTIYSFYISNDCSGFNYWHKQMQEYNYFSLAIAFDTNDLTIFNLDRFYNDLNNFLNDYYNLLNEYVVY